jgi:8-oxo-dGTP pyrophosphatase MutT (NUDIX family)
MGETTDQGDYFSIHLDADGIEFVRTGDEVLIIPLTAGGQVILTLEPSAAFGQPTLILPGGETEPGEPHAETANRELQEEIGYQAGRLDFLGELRPYSKYLTVRSFVYLARELTPSRLKGDEEYEISVEQVLLEKFEQENVQ